MIDIFTKKQFEDALPKHKETGKKMWKPVGLVQGEHAYRIAIDDDASIEIRSSVDKSGVSAECGEDSIRAWLVDSNGNPLGSKVSRWTTRIPGWDERMKGVLRTLWSWRKKAGNCSKCGPKKIFKVKKDGPNKGRIFAKCDCENSFKWLTPKNDETSKI